MIPTNQTTQSTGMTPKMRKVEALNQIVRGEVSAIEAYEQVLEKIKSSPERDRLREFLTTHLKNREYWERQVQMEAIVPDTQSGPWGFVVQAFVGAAKLFGNTSTLMALKQGEEYGLKEYRQLLENPEIDAEDKRYISRVIIPSLEVHLTSIDAMTKMH